MGAVELADNWSAAPSARGALAPGGQAAAARRASRGDDDDDAADEPDRAVWTVRRRTQRSVQRPARHQAGELAQVRERDLLLEQVRAAVGGAARARAGPRGAVVRRAADPPGRRERAGVETVLRWIVAEMVVLPSLSSYTESEEPSGSED